MISSLVMMMTRTFSAVAVTRTLIGNLHIPNSSKLYSSTTMLSRIRGPLGTLVERAQGRELGARAKGVEVEVEVIVVIPVRGWTRVGMPVDRGLSLPSRRQVEGTRARRMTSPSETAKASGRIGDLNERRPRSRLTERRSAQSSWLDSQMISL